jgi:RNA polymerase sigma-70 factor (ECF subfamily)
MRQEMQQQAGAFAEQRRPLLWRMAMKLCHDKDEAADLVQEAITRFIQKFGAQRSLPPVPRAEAWLVKTLSNEYINRCRRLRTQERGTRDPALSAEAREVEPPPAYASITSEQLSAARSTLTPKMREAYDLQVADMKYEDIAAELRIPLGTVKKRLHDARAKLRAYLKIFLTPGEP